MERIPVTILTGFLGSGKTTLLNHILREQHGHRIAVIENEFGEAGVDNELLVQDAEEQIVEMNNGCICCTVRGDLVRILGELASRHRTRPFERVIIETTGLADPAPVAQTFFVESAVQDRYRLDSIVTVVDARHGPDQLTQHHEAQEQVGFADRILVSKTDLVSEQAVISLFQRLRGINPRAPVSRVLFGQADVAALLDVRGFDLDAILSIEPEFLDDVTHEHDDTISSYAWRDERPFDLERLEAFLDGVIRLHGADLLRYKGVVSAAGEANRLVFQGVHMMMAGSPGRPWKTGEKRESVLVFIGRHLPRDLLHLGLEQCVHDVVPAKRPRGLT
jgi:G3E family GTPase